MDQGKLIADLFLFLDGLPKPRFDAGPREHMLVRQFLLRLIAENSWPDDPSKLKTLLAPILCGTPQTQAEFHGLFDEWLKSAPFQSRLVIGSDASATTSRDREGADALWLRWWPAWSGALIVLIAISAYIASPLFQPIQPPPMPRAPGVPFQELAVRRDAPGQIVVSVDYKGRPEQGATVWLPDRSGTGPYIQAVTGPDGKASVPYGSARAWNLLVTHPGFQPKFIEGIAPGGGAVTVSLNAKPTKALLETKLTTLERRFPIWISAALALLPLMILAVWVWRARQRAKEEKAFLDKWETGLALTPLRIHTRPQEDELFQTASIAELARELRRRIPIATRRLNVVPTVKATIARGGLFSPVMEERLAAREFLVLVERKNLRDQQARFFGALLDRLASREVYIDRYFYSSDPSVCETAANERAWIRLDELLALHPNHELWVIGDANLLLDPFTKEPTPSLELLSRWPGGCVLTSAACGTAGEDHIRRLGLRVTGASPQGIGGASAQVDSQPRLLQEEESSWLDRHGPAEDVIRKLDRQLRAYLGAAGYECLLACAVYPGLAWNLTLYLAMEFVEKDYREEALGKLVRLVWFRHGRMPEWLRTFLVAKLEPEQIARILEKLESFVDRAKEQRGEGGGLEFVKRDPNAGVAPDKPLNDYVFLSFLRGQKPKASDVAAPGWLKRLLYPDGRSGFGLRPSVRAALAGLAAISIFAGAEWAARSVAPSTQWKQEEIDLPSAPTPPSGAKLFPARILEIAQARVGEAGIGGSLRDQIYSAGLALFGQTAGVISTPARHLSELQGDISGWIWFQNIASPAIIESRGAASIVTIEVRDGQVRRVKRNVTDMGGVFQEPTLVDASATAPRIGKDGLNYRWIPPGRFMMGCSPGDKECADDEKPAHEVEITKGFWIGETEVTQEAYQRITGQTPSKFKGAKRPVEQVSWTEAKNYCGMIGLRLPAEAEWEYAARAGDTRPRYGDLNKIAWSGEDFIKGSTHDVGGKLPNAWGLHDMLGNVFEWVEDWYGPYSPGFQRDPAGLADGKQHVVRGGSWGDFTWGVRASLRDWSVPAFRNVDVGFRCAGELR